MKRELLLLRHTKSAWDSDAPNDFERPLAKRGIKEAPLIGEWLRRQRLRPDGIVCSPARRTYETVLLVTRALGCDPAEIHFDRRLYEAPLSVLQQIVHGLPTTWRRVLVVGHNPGFDELLTWCCPQADAARQDGKLMTTGAVASVAIAGNWATVSAGSGRLVRIVRPADMARK